MRLNRWLMIAPLAGAVEADFGAEQLFIADAMKPAKATRTTRSSVNRAVMACGE